MSSESQDRRIRELWQGQPVEGGRVSVEQIRAAAGKFHRRIAWRNTREYVALLIVVLFFGFRFMQTEDLLIRIGFVVMIAGCIYVAWNLHAKGRAKSLPPDTGLASCIDFQRRELERQRDLVARVWRWYLGPMIPGLVLLTVAFARANPGHLKHPVLYPSLYLLMMAALFLFVGRLNTRAAKRLQNRLDELDALSRQS